MIWIPTIELIEVIYEKQIGIPVQYANKQQLESALDTLKLGLPFKNTELSIWEKAAILFRNIVQFHVFVDGCKRVGIHTVYIFLRKNGINLSPDDPEEIFRFPMAVAQEELSLEQMQEWLKKNSKIL